MPHLPILTDRLPTPSAIGRAIVCAGSWALPHVRTSNAGAARGTAIDRFVQLWLTRGYEAALSDVPAEYRAECEGLPPLPPVAAVPGMRAQVSYAWDPETNASREIGVGLSRVDRERRLRPGEIGGTLDLDVLEDGVAVSLDVKTGQLYDDYDWQLREYAVMQAGAHRARGARRYILHLVDNRWNPIEFPEASAMEVDAWAETLRTAYRAVRREQERYRAGDAVDVHPGPHCTYCPAWHSCPHKNALVHAAVSGTVLRGEVIDLSDADAGQAWAKVDEAIALLKEAKETLEDRARREPLPLPDGRWLCETPGRETLDGEVASRVLAEVLGVEGLRAVRSSTSKEAIRRCFGGRADGLLDAIRIAGGMKQGAPGVRPVKTQEPPRLRPAEQAMDAILDGGRK